MKGRRKKDRKGSDSEEEVFEMGEDGKLRKVMRKKGERTKDDDEESIYEYVSMVLSLFFFILFFFIIINFFFHYNLNFYICRPISFFIFILSFITLFMSISNDKVKYI